jgi:elongation factor G
MNPKELRRMQRIRNLGIMAHIDAGKTTVTERMLFISGKIHRIGEVHDGNTTMDWMVQERERGITITSAVTTFPWRDADLHLIDTPGHVDFTIEVERSLRVLDGAVAVFDSVHGVEPQSEAVWRQADKFRIPRLAFLNKMDRLGAEFERAFASLEKHFSQLMLPLQAPIGFEGGFRGVIDLLTGVRTVWTDPEDPTTCETLEAASPAEEEVAARFREKLFERLADLDDGVCNKYLAGEEIPLDELKDVLRRVTLSGKAVPVLIGTALRNKGLPPLMDAVVDYLPSPAEIQPVMGQDPRTGELVQREHSANEKLCALAFKVAMMEDGRRMTFLRLYSGKIDAGMELYNATRKLTERPSRVFMMHANHRERLESIDAGNIFSVLGLKLTKTGDTLSDPTAPIVLESIEGYTPVIKMAVEPETSRDKDRLDEVLGKFRDEDPTFNSFEDRETGETIIEGMGELHLEIVADRIRREYKVPVMVGKPQVVYMETISQAAELESVVDRQADNESLYARVRLRLEPGLRGTGRVFQNRCTVPLKPEFVDAVRDGANDASQNGPVGGFEATDFVVALVDAEAREGASTPIAFKMATAMTIEKALVAAAPVKLEPLMELEVLVPDEFMGEVIGDLQSRKGKVDEINDLPTPGAREIRGKVPLGRMFGYSTSLRSMTQGRANFTLKFHSYDIVRG